LSLAAVHGLEDCIPARKVAVKALPRGLRRRPGCSGFHCPFMSLHGIIATGLADATSMYLRGTGNCWRLFTALPFPSGLNKELVSLLVLLLSSLPARM